MFDFVDELSYLGLLISGFLSATILPGSVETVFGYLMYTEYSIVWIICISTIGNSLGGVFSYWMGRWSSKWILRLIDKLSVKKANIVHYFLDRFGIESALFSWLPFVGDFIPIFLGIAKKNHTLVAFYITIGKLLRFIILWQILKIGGF